MGKVIIVNEQDEQIGLKDRADITKKDIYRISGLWVKNSKGQILLAQRKFDKKIEPGCWGPAVAGTNEEGETYESNIYKEAKEELGLESIEFNELMTIQPGVVDNYFVKIYSAVIDLDLEKDITIQPEEVEQVAWFSPDDLKEDIRLNPSSYVKSSPFWESWGVLS